ncbi:Protein nrde2 [Blomia tropicalis]|nr:Protein nrde2 [Blomia tropicalis]
MSLFPAYSKTTDGSSNSTDTTSSTVHSKPQSSSIFPGYSGSNDNNIIGNETETLTKSSYKSYQPDILESWEEKKKTIVEINISSDSSDVQIVEDISKRKKKLKKHKDKKRSDKHKRKKRSSSQDSYQHKSRRSKSPSPSSDKHHSKSSKPSTVFVPKDNKYLEFIPRGRANFIEDIPGLKPQDAYKIDRRSDPDNRAFSSLYAQHVPRYFPKDVIQQTLSFIDETAPKKVKKIKRYFNSKKSKNIKTTSIVSSMDENAERCYIYPQKKLTTQEEYIKLIDINIEPVGQQNFGEGSSAIRFKSMENKDNNTVESIGPNPISNRSQLFHELTSEFNHLLSNDSTIVQIWIDFVRFQDLRSLIESLDRKFSADKKNSIIIKALEKNRRSVALNIIRMKLLSSYWPELGLKFSDVDGEWKKLCFLFPNISELWFEYARFSIRTQSVISFRANSRTRKIFHQAFKNLGAKVLEGDFQSHEIDIHRLERSMIDLIYLSAQFNDSVDQTEKAIAMYQALIEFNLFTPSTFSLETHTFEDWFCMFEQFWDSSVSRVGEFSHVQWKHFCEIVTSKDFEKIKKDSRNIEIFNVDSRMDKAENIILTKLVPEMNSPDEPSNSKSVIWTQLETLRHSLHWLPASAGSSLDVSMESIEDLERVVLSDEDIKPFLFRLRSVDSKYYLSQSFLSFLGIPIITNALNSAPSTSQFEIEYHQNNIENAEEFIKFCSPDYGLLFEANFCNNRYRRFKFPSEIVVLQNYGLSDLLHTNMKNLTTTQLVHEENSDLERNAFINNIFENLIEYWKNNDGAGCQKHRDLILIWFQYKIQRLNSGKESVKTIKRFIKDFLREEVFRNDLNIWFAYSSFEYMQDNQIGQKIFKSTIQLMLNTSSFQTNNHDLLQFTIGFIRLQLKLDTITKHYVNHNRSFSNLNICAQCSNTEIVDEHLIKSDCSKILVAVLMGSNNFQLDQDLSKVEVLKAMKKIDGMENKSYDYLQARIFLEYLTKEMDITSEMIESELWNPQSNFGSNKQLERSFYLLYIQLLLRELYLETIRNSMPSSRRKSLISKIRFIVDQALGAIFNDPLFLSLKVIIEVGLNYLWFRMRRNLGTFCSATEFESYLIQKYINKLPNAKTKNGDMYSNWIHFMASMHSELLILDRVTGQDLEIQSYDISSGVLNRIRHIFERALHYRDGGSGGVSGVGKEDNATSLINTNLNLDDDWLFGKSLADCPTIWRLFLRFELKCSTIRKDSSKLAAKAIMYRALQHCPNHKPLYMDGIMFFPDLLEEFVDIMTDKQIRIRTTIEEVDMFINAEQQKKKKDVILLN